MLQRLESNFRLRIKKTDTPKIPINRKYFEVSKIGVIFEKILNYIGSKSLDQLIQNTVPKNILLNDELKIGDSLSESEAMKKLKVISQKNQTYRNFIDMGYYKF